MICLCEKHEELEQLQKKRTIEQELEGPLLALSTQVEEAAASGTGSAQVADAAGTGSGGGADASSSEAPTVVVAEPAVEKAQEEAAENEAKEAAEKAAKDTAEKEKAAKEVEAS